MRFIFKNNIPSSIIIIQICYLFLSSHSIYSADYQVEKWKVIEIVISSSQTYEDPFNNVDVTASFTLPNGKVIIRPAFWDGGNTWKIRFAPTQIGTWTMITTCSNSTDIGLHNISRSIQCNPYTGNLEVYKHGFLKVDSSGRYFIHDDGTPFFYLGDTHWIFTHERFNSSNVSGVSSQFKYTVDKRVTQGFTVYQSQSIQHPHGGGDHSGADEEAICNFRDGFTSQDLQGFVNMDRKFKYIADVGLIHANSQITWPTDPIAYTNIYTEEYMYKLGRYWVARYGAYPVLWTIAQEIDNDFYGKYDSNTLKKWFAVAQAIADNDAYRQPLSAHMENQTGTTPSNSSWGDKPYHKWWALQFQGEISMNYYKQLWHAASPKPLILYESEYEGFWTDANGVRGNAYKSLQNGIYGFGYGANGIWNDLYSSNPVDYGTAYRMPEKYLNWYTGANLLGSNHMTYFKNFYTSLNWWMLKPRFNNPKWSSFSNITSQILSADDIRKTFTLYYTKSGAASGTLNNLLTNYSYDAQWFSPNTGSYTAINSYTTPNGKWSIPTKPNSEDWLLLLKANSPITPVSSNLALNKSYSSSSDWDANQTANKGFDANYSTNWQAASGSFANQWLMVDFGTNVTFNQVFLSEYGDRTRGYQIQYSNDGATWLIAQTGTTIGTAITVTFSAVTAKMARILFTVGVGTSPIIYEFEFYNSSNNLALNRLYSSSTNWDVNQTANKAFDSNNNTNWQAANGTFANQWLKVDFLTGTTIDQVVLSEYGGRTRGFQIQYSNDGQIWLTAYTGTTIGTSKIINFPALTARMLRTFFTEGIGSAPIIYEFKVNNTSDNLALNKTYSSSTNWDASQTANKAFDSNNNTNWQAINGTFSNQWLMVDFGTGTNFNEVYLKEYGNRTQGFRIEYSDDGVSWLIAHTGLTIGTDKTIALRSVTAKMVRIFFTSGLGNAPIIYEFGIYNRSSINNTQSDSNASIELASTNSMKTLMPRDNDLMLLEGEEFSIYPNPATINSHISFNIPVELEIVITIRDLQGRVVKEIMANSKKSEEYRTIIEASSLNAGIYFVSYTTNKLQISKRLIIL